jgi:hypothetical protein
LTRQQRMGHLPQVFRDLVARLNADQPLGTSRPPLSSGGRTRNEPTQGRLLCLHVGRGITHITGVHFSYAPETLGEYQAIEAVVPWLKFESTVAEAQTLAQPEEFDYSRCSMSDTAACVGSPRCCSNILNSMLPQALPSCCWLSICSATSTPAVHGDAVQYRPCCGHTVHDRDHAKLLIPPVTSEPFHGFHWAESRPQLHSNVRHCHRLPSSLLIENASEQLLALNILPQRHFRSRLTTIGHVEC